MVDTMHLLVNSNSAYIPLKDKTAQEVICSSPYWGLRAYKTHPQIWTSDKPLCEEHEWGDPKTGRVTGSGIRPQQTNVGHGDVVFDSNTTRYTCLKCGAWFGDLGLEPTPEMFADHLVQIFREVKRVLRDDGVMLLNLGDSYIGGKGASGAADPKNQEQRVKDGKSFTRAASQANGGKGKLRPNDDLRSLKSSGLKAKDVSLIPMLVAMALRKDGWYLRQVFPWFKWNVMPGSQQDRPTTSHEYWFLFSKSKKYYWDHHAIKVPYTKPLDRWGGDDLVDAGGGEWSESTGQPLYRNRNLRPDPQGRTYRTSDTLVASLEEYIEEQEKWLEELKRFKNGGTGILQDPNGDILAAVYNTESYKGQHYATFGKKMITPFILAGSSDRCCEICGAPWIHLIKSVVDDLEPVEPIERNGILLTPEDSAIVWKLEETDGDYRVDKVEDKHGHTFSDETTPGGRKKHFNEKGYSLIYWQDAKIDIGLHPSCKHDNRGTGKSIVLDPFVGSGTTLLVAEDLGRDGIGLDLSFQYLKEEATKRLEKADAERAMTIYKAKMEANMPKQASLF